MTPAQLLKLAPAAVRLWCWYPEEGTVVIALTADGQALAHFYACDEARLVRFCQEHHISVIE